MAPQSKSKWWQKSDRKPKLTAIGDKNAVCPAGKKY
jgi:hypothetical protein